MGFNVLKRLFEVNSFTLYVFGRRKLFQTHFVDNHYTKKLFFLIISKSFAGLNTFFHLLLCSDGGLRL